MPDTIYGISTPNAITAMVAVIWAGLGLVVGVRYYINNSIQVPAMRIGMALVRAVALPPYLIAKGIYNAYMTDA